MSIQNKNYALVINTPLGQLELVEEGDRITHCTWSNKPVTMQHASDLLSEAAEQLAQYFNQSRTQFTLPLSPQGTPFQQAVWQALLTIPYGETCSYQAIAQQLGRAKASRAVGTANGKNPICIFIPCHRVIRASGEWGGYSGTPARKKQLLELENGNLIPDDLQTF